jgi:hypothetical protein
MAASPGITRGELFMSSRTLIRWLVLLALLVGVAYWLQTAPGNNEIAGLAAGSPVFTELDVNDINRIELVTRYATNILVRQDSGWVAVSFSGYPAYFPRIASFLRSLVDLTVGQVMRGGEQMLAEFGLDTNALSPDYVAIALQRSEAKPVVFALGSTPRPRHSSHGSVYARGQ